MCRKYTINCLSNYSISNRGFKKVIRIIKRVPGIKKEHSHGDAVNFKTVDRSRQVNDIEARTKKAPGRFEHLYSLHSTLIFFSSLISKSYFSTPFEGPSLSRIDANTAVLVIPIQNVVLHSYDVFSARLYPTGNIRASYVHRMRVAR